MTAAIPAGPIDGVVVVVPARDEEDLITACVQALRVAVARAPVAAAVVVVLDRCTDRTAARAAAALAGWASAGALPLRDPVGSGVGAVRDVGARAALARLRMPPDRVWVLTTDADSVVPPDWVLAHLRLAAAGAVAVAGTVDLGAAHPDLHAGCGVECAGEQHVHVYGANLGVRADAYLAAGGFAPDGPGEDTAMVAAVRRAGLTVVAPTAIRVRTSARVRGRATGGLADLLRSGSVRDNAHR